MASVSLKPLGDRILVEPIDAEEKTAGGIVLPDTAKEKPQQGKVVAVGSGRLKENGERLPMSVEEGQTVLFARYAGTEVKLNGKDYLIMSESEVLAIVED
ncbi:MAG: co-chaperone GroES [Firmicutes bacterium]|jgi:chaperonin GroES|nr:co-chaperone GroES [Bacillota bacterium]